MYKPTNYGTTDNMPGPAPLGTYATSLSAFNGSDPNGTWSLYVVDDAQVDAGSITSGWSLTLAWEVSVPPPWLSSPTILSDGRFKTTLNGLSGKTYVIETSVDLSSWTPAQTNTLSGTTFDFVDGNITNSSRRFYRAVYHP